jgi:hypothetical protein
MPVLRVGQASCLSFFGKRALYERSHDLSAKASALANAGVCLLCYLASCEDTARPVSGGTALVADSIRHFDGQRYKLLAYVIMDDHVHVLVLPFEENSLEHILHSWKSFTAKRLRSFWRRSSPVWQDEYFDRVIRDEAELIEKTRYILGNPPKRWSEIQDYP